MPFWPRLEPLLAVSWEGSIKLQLHDAIYRLRFYSNSLIHILSFSNSHNNVASLQKNPGDKSHRVIVALGYNYTVRFIAPILLYRCYINVQIWKL